MADITTYLGLEKPIPGEKYSRALYNRNMDRVELNAQTKDTEFGKHALGLVWQSHVGSSSGNVADAVINNIATFTFKANRRYRIVWDFSYLMTGTGSLFYVSINKCAVSDPAAQLSGMTPLEGRTKGIVNHPGSTQHSGPVVSYHIQNASDETTQIKFRVQRVVGGDGLTIVGQANERCVYSIYDDGLQEGSIS